VIVVIACAVAAHEEVPMASHSSPLLLDLRDEDFQRGFTGSRPPSLISPAPASKPTREREPVAAPRSGRAKTLLLFLTAIAGSVIASRLLSPPPPQHIVVGLEAVQEAPAATAEQKAVPPEPITAPAVAVVSKPVVTAMVAPARPVFHAKPTPASVKSVTPAPEAPPKAETPTFGVEEAGF